MDDWSENEEDWDGDDAWGYSAEDSTKWSCNCCGMNNHPIMPVCEICGMKKADEAPKVQDVKTTSTYGLFLSDATIQDHEKDFLKQKSNYIKKLKDLLDSGISITSATNLGGVLDAPRKVRALKRKLQVLETRAEQSRNQKERPPNQSLQRVKNKTKKKINFEIAMLERECLSTGGVTNSINKKIRRWIKTIPAHKLEFYLLNFPKEPWRQLSDICHSSPSDFTLDYFQQFIHNGQLPEDCLVAKLQEANAGMISSLLEQYPNLFTCYSYLRKIFEGQLSDQTKKQLSEKAPLEDILWFYEELHSSEVENIVYSRLASGETIVSSGRERGSYGKLMERLLTFRSMKLRFVPELMIYAEQKLSQIAMASDSRVVVMGDASASMEVAIQVSTIIGSLLTVCLKAELLFFNDRIVFPSIVPSSAADVLRITEEIKAERCTSPALALYKYYKMKQPVDLFIIVGDEEENTPCQGMMFAALFQKYLKEINEKAKIFLVSFLDGPPTFLGKMRASLRTFGIGCQQFRLDAKRPDLSKLPHLLGMLSLETMPLGEGNPQLHQKPESEEKKEESSLISTVQTQSPANEDVSVLISSLSEEERDYLKNNPTKISELIKQLALENSVPEAPDSSPKVEPPPPPEPRGEDDDEDGPS
eukprot:CAMPEP_0117852122 /NCGR_PEP_ID=MMETSP0949-20121206/22874_1 /TAXON_ID=44440 /ORGANISM="Chattonella subsalsa, Strain CCMP2191" /LENGTH=645 /DNA_ID=CAMNT_0005700205 /DNA_START=24 /DNA_END=1962 /DNA_ORIENTATION=-